MSGLQRKPPEGRRFQKGMSGNPKGRPAAIVAVVELARSYTTQAYQALAQIMMTPPDSIGQSDAARVAAAKEMLDRGWGKAPQHVHLTGDTAPLSNHIPSPGQLVTDALSLVGRELAALRAKGSLGPDDQRLLVELSRATALLVREEKRLLDDAEDSTLEQIDAEITRRLESKNG